MPPLIVQLMRPILGTFCIFLWSWPLLAELNIFDMPQRHPRHMQLLGLMELAHQQTNYNEMAKICYEGLALKTDATLWYYNLACALALLDESTAALEALQKSFAAGLHQVEPLLEDPDLKTLHDLPAFQEIVAALQKQAEDATPPESEEAALLPDQHGDFIQSAANTGWNFQLALFETAFKLPANATNQLYRGPEAPRINRWIAEGSASGCQNLLYVNRDNDFQPLSLQHFPGLQRLRYSQDVQERELNTGLPNTLFFDLTTQQVIPVIGHSAFGLVNTSLWRSLSRVIGTDNLLPTTQSLLMHLGQLFFYPAMQDYTAPGGDLFPAHHPYCMAVVGEGGDELFFVEAALAALAAIPPTTRATLTQRNELMLALNVLFRTSLRTLRQPHDYLSWRAHPVAFQQAQLDVEALVTAAHHLTPEQVVAPASLKILSEEGAQPNIDFFDLMPNETIYDSPFAIARVFRGKEYTRTIEIEAVCHGPYQKIHWVLLQGDASKITLTPDPQEPTRVTIKIAHHAPFAVPYDENQEIITARVDIAAIVENNAHYSLPALLSYYFLPNEKREYTPEGRLLAIDYQQPHAGYTDPLLSAACNWRDVYQYHHDTLIGWQRIRGLNHEEFSVHGHRVITRDPLGRPLKVHAIKYFPRQQQTAERQESLPELAQIDDNIELIYHYSSDQDLQGTAEPKP